jgi:oligosaccharide translocation protein RFT1
MVRGKQTVNADSLNAPASIPAAAPDLPAATSAFTGVRSFFLLNLLQKLVTFSLNQCLINLTSPEVFGQAAVQLELLLSTVLFLSREGIRIATLRTLIPTGTNANNDDSNEQHQQFQRLVNLSWVPCMLISVAIIVLSGSIVCGYQFQSVDIVTVLLYCCGAFLEALGEPLFNAYQNALQLRPQMRADTAAVFARSLVTVFVVAYLQWGVRGFGVAQMSYGLVHFLTLLSCVNNTPLNGRIRQLHEYLPRRIASSSPTASSSKSAVTQFVDLPLFTVAMTATGSSLLKHLLTEADKIMLSLLVSNYDQGIFAVANNYGSLVARLIYLPVENACRLAFSKLAAEIGQQAERCAICVQSADDQSSSHVNTRNSKHKTDAVEVELQGTLALLQTKVQEMKSMLLRLLVAVAAFGCIFPLFGLPYISLLVNVLLSSSWRKPETVQTLSCYCVYLLVLGLNGISESFVQSVAAPKAFVRLNIGLCVSTVVYVGVAAVCVRRFGTSGLVMANIASMCVRIISSLLFVHAYFKRPADHYLEQAVKCNKTDNSSEATAKLQQIVKTTGSQQLSCSPIDDVTVSLRSLIGANLSRSVLFVAVLTGSIWALKLSARGFDSSLLLMDETLPTRARMMAFAMPAVKHIGLGAIAFAVTCTVFVFVVVTKAEIMKTVRLLTGKQN